MTRPPRTISKHKTPTGVLQSVALITGQRDRDLMAISLVNTLVELIHCNRIAMYRIVPGDQSNWRFWYPNPAISPVNPAPCRPPTFRSPVTRTSAWWSIPAPVW